jgi:hypothetical protein
MLSSFLFNYFMKLLRWGHVIDLDYFMKLLRWGHVIEKGLLAPYISSTVYLYIRFILEGRDDFYLLS